MSEFQSAAAYQLPLFDTYDIAVAFEQRLKYVDASVVGSCADQGAARIVKRIQDALTVCPLELFRDRATLDVKLDGRMRVTGEPVYAYVYQIPYHGDPELWSLRPTDTPRFDEPMTEGEAQRGSLTFGLLVASPDEAEQLFEAALSQFELVLSAQAREIETFNRTLPALIWQKLIHHRTGFSVPEADARYH